MIQGFGGLWPRAAKKQHRNTGALHLVVDLGLDRADDRSAPTTLNPKP